MIERFDRLRIISCMAFVCFGASAAFAGDENLRNACFAENALAAVPGEETAAKGNRTFDASIKLNGFTPASPVPDALRGAIRRV
ncbi:MAG: polysaccharide deacetylase, partial [Proteobacteria bacterium]|nr:polysaccharide deacetylase [Pseudomonadota bacterium]